MAHRRARALILLTACALALCACSVAPRGKTIRLDTQQPSATAKTSSPGAIGWLKKANPIPLEELDQAGYFYINSGMELVYGWLDNNHLAAVGTRPVTQEPGTPRPSSEAEQKALNEKLREAKRVSPSGIVGQILSVDWQTLETTELHTVQDEVITSMRLSHDKSKLWYLATDTTGMSKLSVSDISFKHDMLNIQDYSGAYPAWSSLDKYLYFINYSAFSKKSEPPLTLFDGVNTLSLPYKELTMGGLNLIGVDDDAGRVNTIMKNSVIIRIDLEKGGQPAYDLKQNMQAMGNGKDIANGPVYRAEWVGSDYVLMMNAGEEVTSLGILDIASGEPPYWYDDVINFALSDDGKYICLVRDAAGNTADVSVAEWRDGAFRNETVLFQGFIATSPIYFSPDSTKLFLQGRYNYADMNPTALVLQFR